MGSNVSQLWQQGAARARSLVVSSGMAANAKIDLTQRVPLSAGLCWLLFKEHPSPHSSALQAKSESCCPVGAQGERMREEDGHLRSNTTKEAINPNTEEKMAGNVLEITRGREHLRSLIDRAAIDRASLAGSFRVPSLKALTHSTWWALLCPPFESRGNDPKV